MARVTVDDCMLHVPNRFELVILAARRARQLTKGEEAMVPIDNDKNTVLALREIGEGAVDIQALYEEEPLPEEEPEAGGVDPETGALMAEETQVAGVSEDNLTGVKAANDAEDNEESQAAPSAPVEEEAAEEVEAVTAETGGEAPAEEDEVAAVEAEAAGAEAEAAGEEAEAAGAEAEAAAAEAPADEAEGDEPPEAVEAVEPEKEED